MMKTKPLSRTAHSPKIQQSQNYSTVPLRGNKENKMYIQHQTIQSSNHVSNTNTLVSTMPSFKKNRIETISLDDDSNKMSNNRSPKASEKRYKCGVCPISFLNSRHLKEHELQHSTNKSPIKIDIDSKSTPLMPMKKRMESSKFDGETVDITDTDLKEEETAQLTE